MKSSKIFLAAALTISAAFGEVSADYVDGEKSIALITPQVEAAAAFLGTDIEPMMHALKLQMTKYDMDMRTQAGRKAWHGRLIAEEVHTNELVKVEVYSNEVSGAIWRYSLPFKPVQPKPTDRKITYSTNGIPARLVAARAKRAAEINGGTVTTNVVTIGNR